MKRLAVHLHLYYRDQLPEMAAYLDHLTGTDYDLFVTMVQSDEDVIQRIKVLYPNAVVWIVPNKGYDVGPFIDFLHRINLDEYEYVLKIHTKGITSQNHTWLNGHRMNNRLWRRILLDALLKDKERVIGNLSLLDQTPEVGMLSSRYCVTKEKRTYQNLLPQINQALIKCGFQEVQEVCFVAGTMFYVRAWLLKPLLAYTIKDFASTDAQVKEGTFAHVAERLFGALVVAQGYTIRGIGHDHYTGCFVWASLKHFLYQKKQTRRRLLIKIFKIPVYSKKLESEYVSTKEN